MRLARVFLAAALVPCLLVLDAAAQQKIPVRGTDRYRIKYADGTTTINDLCPVAKRGIGSRQTPIYVNGRPVGFC